MAKQKQVEATVETEVITPKKYVVIHSNINIRVTPALLAVDETKKDSDVPNRLKVKPSWPKATVLIQKGQGYYPNCIKFWPTVKAYVAKGIMSIAGECDRVGELGTSEIAEATASKVDAEVRAINKAIKESNAELVEPKKDEEAEAVELLKAISE